jgi:hypothetical protein
MSQPPAVIEPSAVRDHRGRFMLDVRSEETREIVRRLRAGECHDTISDALTLTKAARKHKCLKIAAALGLPEPRSSRELLWDEVERRSLAGETIKEIAAATGGDRR